MKDYKSFTLKNGLTILIAPNNATSVMTAMIMFKVGSRNETDDVAGISHLLEHMHYKGGKKRKTAIEVAEFIESIGGQHNAFTNKELTGYYVKFTPKHLEKVLDFLSDNIVHSTFKSKDLESEKNVIVEEINMYEDLPMMIVGDRFEEAVFGDNHLGRDIIGTKKTVKNVSRDKLINYRNKFYSASNAVLVLAGNLGEFNNKETVELVEKYFKLPDFKTEKPEKIQINNKKTVNLKEKNTEQSHVVVGFKTVALNHPDFFKVELLATVLGGGMSSRMFEEIREKKGLAYSVRTSTSVYLEAGALYTQAGVPHEKIYEATEAMMKEYKKITLKAVSKSELNKAKEMTIGKILIRLEDSEEVADHYATEVLFSEKILTPDDIVKIYKKITPSDILETAKKYFVEQRLALAFIGKKIDKKRLDKILSI